MKERPLLFSAPMVRALIAGTKSQTRRVVKAPGWDPASPEYGGLTGIKQHADERIGLQAYFWHARSALAHGVRCPYGQPGDRLWVRETWHVSPHFDCLYRADYADGAVLPKVVAHGGWKPSIFMPRAASRITLEVTGVRVERLQDISTADCWAEGLSASPDVDPVHEYRDLWEAINGPGSWDANPWVWALEFRRLP